MEKIVFHGDAAAVIASLPRPIVHVKGFGSRLALGNSPDPCGLRAETEQCAAAFLKAVLALNTATIFWDGDELAPDSFTALIPRLVAGRPELRLCAILHERRRPHFTRTWSAFAATLGAPIDVIIVADPPPSMDGADKMRRFAALGIDGFRLTGSKFVYCFGGGGVVKAEVELADEQLTERPRWTLVPARRAAADGASVEQSALWGLEVEHYSVSDELQRAHERALLAAAAPPEERRQAPKGATPPSSYVCNVCGAAGDHWRSNCAVVRAEGRQDLFGNERAKKFGRGPPNLKAIANARPPPPPPGPPLDADAPWDANELDGYPMRESCLQQNVLVADLDPPRRARLVGACVAAFCMARNPEVGRAIAACAAASPASVRAKELVESLEAYAVVEAFVSAMGRRGRAVDVIADVACGHGLVGILLAYRFPRVAVVCCDLEERESYRAMVEAFRREGAKLDGWAAPLQNLEFVEGLLDGAAMRGRLEGKRACVVALHACTEANGAAVDLAQSLGALWCLMPCCMRSDACAPAGCQLMCGRHDDSRHALLCGALAERHGAQLVAAIDRRVTNRNLVLCGGGAPGGPLVPPRARDQRRRAAAYADEYGVHEGGAAESSSENLS